MSNIDPLRFRKKFEVEKLEGKREKKFIRYVAKKDELTDRVMKTREEYTKEVDAGYNVYTSRGAMIHFWDHKALVKAGFGSRAETIDMETGVVVPVQEFSLKDLAQAKQMQRSVNSPFAG